MEQQGGPGAAYWITVAAILVFFLASLWKVFTKAGKPGWASIIPVYNLIVILQIAQKPAWWVLLLLIPGVNIFFLIVTYLAFAKNFGKGVGFALGLTFLNLIFIPILAWGSARYQPGPGTPQPA